MSQTIIRIITGIFASVITAAALWIAGYFGPIEELNMQLEDGALPGWQKIDMDGRAIFYIPPGLRRVNREPRPLYRDFRNDRMQFYTTYTNPDGNATCIVLRRKRANGNGTLTEFTIDGRDAIIG